MRLVRGQDFNARPRVQQARQKLDLLTIKSNDSDLLLYDTACQKSFRYLGARRKKGSASLAIEAPAVTPAYLVEQISLCLVLHESTRLRFSSWQLIRVDENYLAPVLPSIRRIGPESDRTLTDIPFSHHVL